MGATYSHGVWEQFADQASTIFLLLFFFGGRGSKLCQVVALGPSRSTPWHLHIRALHRDTLEFYSVRHIQVLHLAHSSSTPGTFKFYSVALEHVRWSDAPGYRQ